MRVFWAVVALLVLVGVGLPAVRSFQRTRESAAAARAMAEEARTREVEQRARAAREAAAAEQAAAEKAAAAGKTGTNDGASEPAPAPPPVSEAKPEPAAAPQEKTSAAAQTEQDPVPTAPTNTDSVEKAEAIAAEPPKAVEELPAPSKEAETAATDPKASEPTELAEAAAEASPAVAESAPEKLADAESRPVAETTEPGSAVPGEGNAIAGANGTPQGESAPAADSAGAKIEKKPDGTMLVDDKFVVKGEGTRDKPYEVSWDMLVSAQETYDPRQGRKRLPERLTMLNDKYVRITGYIAFPMFVEQPRELLSMLNQWDGCCIGVPPTPYDAVEVHLAEPVNKEQRAGIYGVVTGKFGVKPYLAGDWLIGLYLMENAEFESKGFGGT